MTSTLNDVLSTLFAELIEGADSEVAWVLNPRDGGLLRSLEKLSADDASRVPQSGGASIAAHVDHLRYGFHLLNRWSEGDDPFATADYAASWRRIRVTPDEWNELQAQLRLETQRWQHVLHRPDIGESPRLTGVIASIAHLAYHLGAMRQIDRQMVGPEARD